MLRVVKPGEEVFVPEEEKFWILIKGNPVKGLTFHGPFGSETNVMEFADENMRQHEDWWVAELEDTSSLVGENQSR